MVPTSVPPPTTDVQAHRRLWRRVLLTFVLALGVSSSVVLSLAQQRRVEMESAARNAASAAAHDLSTQLERALHAAYALAALVRQGRGHVPEFESIAREMLLTYGSVSALQLAPGGVVSAIVPLKGNEAALGFSPLDDPRQGPEARRVVAQRALGLTGPFELRQGGLGVVGRLPVFLNDDEGHDQFWGLTQVVVRMNDLLASTRLADMAPAGYDYELWRLMPGGGGTRQVIARSSTPSLVQPVVEPIRVPQGQWHISVAPRQGWTARHWLFMGLSGAGVFSALVALAVHTLLRQPLWLRQQVHLRTRELAASEARFRELNADLEARVQERTQRLAAEVEERRQAEAAAQQNAQWLREIIDSLSSGVVLWDRNQKLMAWNRRFEALFPETVPFLHPGIGRKELGQSILKAGDQPIAAHEDQHWDRLGRAEEITHDGRVLVLERLATSDGGRLVLSTDITEDLRTKEALARNDRMASLGSLVAGVAHEINTPLGNALMVASSIADGVEAVQRDVNAGSLKRSQLLSLLGAVRESSQMLQRNLQRAATLIQNFKQVAVDQTSDRRRSFDLAEVMEELNITLQPRLKQTPHQMVVDVAPGLAMDSYPGALGQILTNLVENALLHAFDEHPGGLIHIHGQSLDGDRVLLQISDNGSGIPEAVRPRVFDPFFTTKLGQGGSGLGLSIVLNLVQDLLGGELHVHSRPGGGTTFEINLPCVAPKYKDNLRKSA